jgi:hypothetical protein
MINPIFNLTVFTTVYLFFTFATNKYFFEKIITRNTFNIIFVIF